MEKSKYLRSILSLQEIYRSKIIPDKEEDGELILIKSFLLRSRADAVQLYRPFLFQSGKEELCSKVVFERDIKNK